VRKYIEIILSKIYVLLKKGYNCNQYEIYRKKYDIHPSFIFNGDDIIFYGDGEIIIEENCYIGRNSYIQSVEGCKVFIGRNTSISHHFAAYTTNRNTTIGLPGRKGDIIIGRDVWIGYRVFIKEGCKIGDNSVIGAHAVVINDIPSNCIAVGIPARVIKCK